MVRPEGTMKPASASRPPHAESSGDGAKHPISQVEAALLSACRCASLSGAQPAAR